MSKTQIGLNAESFACDYLRKLGYKVLERNFRIRGGEIDIVAKEGPDLVFVEVKARFNHQFGLPQEAITYYKLKALEKTALFYIQKAKWGEKPYRFDVLAIDYSEDKQNPEVELIKNITA